VARRAERLATLAASLEAAHGVAVHCFPLDLTASDATGRLTAWLAERGLEVGILVQNAGFGIPRSFHESDPDELARMVDLHCRLPVLLTRALVPGMIARRSGAIIVVASVAGYLASPGSMSVYGPTKAFDLHFGESLWAELRPFGIDALAVAPGYTRTEFHQAGDIDPSALPAWAWSDPDGVARTALESLGKRASAVHGLLYKALCTFIRLVPRSSVNALAGPLFFRRVEAERARRHPPDA
jgi:hypothetical protein